VKPPALRVGGFIYFDKAGVSMTATTITECAKRYATVSEVAIRYRTSDAQIYQWIRELVFPSKSILRLGKSGKKILFNLDVLDDWEASGGCPVSYRKEPLNAKGEDDNKS
jgi:hypothetical protein